MNVELETKKGVTIAKIIGDLDHHTAKNIRSDIDREVKEHHCSLLILDFSGVTFMDSSGIGLVMGRYKELKKCGGELHIINTTPHITKVMKLSGIERLAKLGKAEK